MLIFSEQQQLHIIINLKMNINLPLGMKSVSSKTAHVRFIMQEVSSTDKLKGKFDSLDWR